MSLEILEKETDYIVIKVATKGKKQKFIKTEEDIEKKVNELGKILTKDAMEKLNEEKKVIEKDGKNMTFKKK